MQTSSHTTLTPRLLSGLYTEAMVLADEARSCFDRNPADFGMSSQVAVAFSCESLKVSTRLMHCIAWLLGQKALLAGEISEAEAMSEARQLGYAPASDDFMFQFFPEEAKDLIQSSEDLYYRLQRMGNGLARPFEDSPIPHAMLARLQEAF